MSFQKKHIPNILTILRIALVPIIVTLILVPSSSIIYCFTIGNEQYTIHLYYFIAGILFVGACITDALDGYLARRNKWVSSFGKLWDPIADKLLINSILICFAFQNLTFIWVPIIMIARDVIVDALRMYASSQKKVIPANMFGKLKTIFQMLAIMIIFFIFNGTNTSKCLNYYFYQNLLMYVALITSLVSGVIYFRKYGKR